MPNKVFTQVGISVCGLLFIYLFLYAGQINTYLKITGSGAYEVPKSTSTDLTQSSIIELSKSATTESNKSASTALNKSANTKLPIITDPTTLSKSASTSLSKSATIGVSKSTSTALPKSVTIGPTKSTSTTLHTSDSSELPKPDDTGLGRPNSTELPNSDKSQLPKATSCRKDSLDEEHLLVAFTTFKEVPERDYIQRNTVFNWGSLRPHVQPMLFTNDSELNSNLTNASCQWNWITHPLLRVNYHGTPLLKDMYRAAKEHVKSKFYGYCNGDILFDDGLIKTLESVSRHAPPSKSALVIGQRTNVETDIHSNTPLYEPEVLQGIAQKKGRLFRTDAEDYFFIWQPQLFPWHTIKDVVVGRPAYDNYMVGQAVSGGVTVVDATKTVLAYHQTGLDGNFAGKRNKDASYNTHIIGPYNYNRGLTYSGRYFTRWGPNNTVELIRK